MGDNNYITSIIIILLILINKLLINGDLGGDLGPQTGVFHWCHWFLGVTIHMHVQHEAAERSTQVVGQVLVWHAAQDQVNVQLTWDFVDGQVLPVEAHAGKQVQLVPDDRRKYYSGHKNQILIFKSLNFIQICTVISIFRFLIKCISMWFS